MLGVNVSFVLLLFAIGVVSATAPMIAQDLGRQRHAVREPRRTVRQGFWVALLLGLPATVILWQIAPILALLRQEPALIVAAEDYVHAAMWGFVPALWFVVLRNFIASLERPRAAMVIMLIGVSFNAIAAYGLIFGRLGLPALGLAGAGLAAALTNIFLVRGPARLHPDRPALSALPRAGAFLPPRLGAFPRDLPHRPADRSDAGRRGGALHVRCTVQGWISSEAVAAHAIALQCAALAFMVPLGLSQATTVRVGLAFGSASPRGVKLAGTTGAGHRLRLHAGHGADHVVGATPGIVGLFIDAADPSNRARGAGRGSHAFLAIAALFQIFDGGQVIGAGALRGLKDTRWPMLFAGIAYWAVGMVCAVGLGFGVGLGGLGVWLGLAAGLAVAAGLMIGRFYRLQARVAGRARLAASGGPGVVFAFEQRKAKGRPRGQGHHQLRCDRQHHQARPASGPADHAGADRGCRDRGGGCRCLDRPHPCTTRRPARRPWSSRSIARWSSGSGQAAST